MKGLSQTAVTLIRDGVAPRDMSAENVRRALFRAALAAVNAEWSCNEFIDVLMESPTDSLHGGLFVQFVRNGGERGRRLGTADALVRVRSVWDRAATYAEDHPLPTEDERKAAATERIDTVERTVRVMATTEDVRLVLRYAVAEARRRESVNVTLPRRDVMRGTALSDWRTRAAIKGACATGLLTQKTAGHASKNPNERKAAVYTLTVPAVLPSMDGRLVAEVTAERKARSAVSVPVVTSTGGTSPPSTPKQNMGGPIEYGRSALSEYGRSTEPIEYGRSVITMNVTNETKQDPPEQDPGTAPQSMGETGPRMVCPHGLTLHSPGRESAFDRGAHMSRELTYGPGCWL